MKRMKLILVFLLFNLMMSANTVKVSYYHNKFHGRKTANGETYDKCKLTAAHKTLPFGTMVKITNPKNGKSVIVRINDRGPFIKGRVFDLSLKAAQEVGIIFQGVASLEYEILEDETS